MPTRDVGSGSSKTYGHLFRDGGDRTELAEASRLLNRSPKLFADVMPFAFWQRMQKIGYLIERPMVVCPANM
jgi:hypothetical protein